jgi:hypothetical protein
MNDATDSSHLLMACYSTQLQYASRSPNTFEHVDDHQHHRVSFQVADYHAMVGVGTRQHIQQRYSQENCAMLVLRHAEQQ